MTDKQIINGVDVSGCIYYEDGYCTISKQAYCYCCDKPNCHYKNWQRKEQECERLKNLFEGVRKSLEVEIEECSKWSQLETEARFELVKTQQQIDQLKAENEELKKKCNIYTCGICGNKEDCNKLYKTLTEIKNKLTVHKTLYYESKLIEKLHKEILQKISECEE